MIKDFCNDLNQYLLKEYNYKIPPARIHLETINVKRQKVELYIRFMTETSIWQNDTVVLARIAFETKGKGNGRSLLNFLVNKAQKYSYCRIGIEQTNKESAAFAKSFGFQDMREGKHWIISVEELRNKLNTRHD